MPGRPHSSGAQTSPSTATSTSATRRTPPEVVGRLNAALREATTLPDVRRRAEEGGVLLRPLTVAEMDAVARREIETLGRTIRENGITLE